MKTILSVLLFLLSFTFLPKTNACTCPQGHDIDNFCGTLKENSRAFSCEVLEQLDFAHLLVKVIDSITFMPHQDTIIIYGDNGLNCGQPLGAFEPGDSMIFIGQGPGPSETYDSSYFIYVCKLSYLRYSNGNVIGSIYPGVSELPYQVFLDNMEDCVSFTVLTNQLETDYSIKLNPNPAGSYFNILSDYKIKQVQIYNTSGHLIKSPLMEEGIKLRINIADLSTGIFLVKTKTEKGVLVTKLVVMH